MAKKGVAAMAGEIAERLAQEMGYEFVDAELVRERGSAFLRIYVDQEGGLSLDACEAFHRAVQKRLEQVEYDYLEVSSPGLDRPLKREKDFERAKGKRVEVKLFQAVDGVKRLTGRLQGLEGEEVALLVDGGETLRLPRKACALIRPMVEIAQEELEE